MTMYMVTVVGETWDGMKVKYHFFDETDTPEKAKETVSQELPVRYLKRVDSISTKTL